MDEVVKTSTKIKLQMNEELHMKYVFLFLYSFCEYKERESDLMRIIHVPSMLFHV